MGKRKKRLAKVRVIKLLKNLPIVIMVLMLLVFVLFFRNISVTKILEYTPSNIYLAVVVILLFYTLETFMMVFPVPVIYAACGAMFSHPIALSINFVGIIITLSVSYSIGRYSNARLTRKIAKKYPKIQKITELEKNREWFLAFILRLIPILPVDIISQFFGSMKMSYKSFMIGSLLGMVPIMIAVTYMGTSITDPLSPEFLVAAIATVVLTVVSLYIYKKLGGTNEITEKEQAEE